MCYDRIRIGDNPTLSSCPPWQVQQADLQAAEAALSNGLLQATDVRAGLRTLCSREQHFSTVFERLSGFGMDGDGLNGGYVTSRLLLSPQMA